MKIKPLHERLVEARLKAGFANPVEASKHTALSYGTIYRAESGKYQPNRQTLVALAVAYGLAEDTFLKNNDDSQAASGRVTIQIDLPNGLSPDVRTLMTNYAHFAEDDFRQIATMLQPDAASNS